MPKDIRSYFSKVSTQPKQNGLEKKTNNKKRAIIESDEEDAEESSVIKNKKAKINQNEEKVKTSKLTEIPVSSTEKLFSKKPIKRVAAPKVTKKVKNTSKDKSSDLFDDEFDESLNQIDTSNFEEKIVEKNDAVNKKSNKHEAEISKNNNEEQDNKTGVKKSDSKSDKNSKKEKKEKKESKAKYEMEITKSDASEKEKKKPKDDIPDFIQEKIEKKKGNAKLYQNYLNRGGARNPGSKEIPKGADSCLSGLTFIISGVLDSLEREEAEEIIKQYGGNVVKSVSKKLDYIIIGDQAGPSKLLKAECLGIKKLSEDDLLELIKTRPGGVGNEKVSLSKESRKIESPKKKEPNIPVKSNSENNKRRKSESPKKNKEDVKESHKKVKYDTTESPKKKDVNNYSKTETSNSQDEKKNASVDLKQGRERAEASTSKVEVDKKVPTKNSTPSSLTLHCSTALVDKYRPKEMKQIIGQSGDKSNAKKLYNWLSDWHKKLDVKKSKAKPTHKDDAGAIFKAALLSGPPGIGKTTTAHVVATNLGFDVIEFNASDTRSKKLLQAEISSLLSNTNLKSLMTDKSKNIKNSKHVLIMDEVDGMAGNEDRGGLQELITLIKNTEVPIICICNDRMNQKMRTLGDYTYDLRFQKPRIEQIKGAMMTLCCRENIKISPDELQLLIQATNQDIRQIINHLALLSSKATEVNKPQEKLKNLRLGPWDVVRKVFSADEHKHMNLYDKSDLFFHDYNIASLFVQENYLSVVPAGSKGEINKLEKVSKSSESLALGDLIEKKIRESSAWSLLPVQAIFSSVIPGATMSGYITSQINFPQWLGKNSRRNKFDRLMQDITMHTQLTTGANKEAINLDYVKLMLNSIVRPLINDGLDGIDAAVDVMVKYNLLREDLDSLIELNTWPGKTNPMQSIDTKVKTAFTKACNKKVSKPVATFSKKRKNMSTEDDVGSDQDKSDNDDDEDDIKNDKMIKAKITKNNSDKGEGSGSKTKNTKKTEAAGKKSSKKTTASKKK